MLSETLLKTGLTRAVKHGTLKLTTARGEHFTFGDGTEPKVAIRFTDEAAQLAEGKR